MESLRELVLARSHSMALGILIAGAVIFPFLLAVPAPYGRHWKPGWGPTLSARTAWVVQEVPSFVIFVALWAVHPQRGALTVFLPGLLFTVHYFQRVFVYSLMQRGAKKPNPLLTVLMAIAFNAANASGNAVSLAARPLDAAFLAGVAIFLAGFAVNLHSDRVLRGLRGPGETGYKIPTGGLYQWVSAPNYLGEMMEWLGFAIATQTLAGWAFFAFTFANLAPRALTHHRWYRAKFPEYPRERRALIPYVL